MLLTAVRRSMTGRWNTMARRVPSVPLLPPQLIVPDVGATSPMPTRISVLLPEPFGPTSTVGPPGPNVSETRSRIVTPPATTDALSSMIGRSLLSARIISPGPQLADAAHAPGGGVDEDDDDHQHEAEAHG